MSIEFCYANCDLRQYFFIGLFGTNSGGEALGRNEGARALTLLISERGSWRGQRISLIGSTSEEMTGLRNSFVDIEVEAELMLLEFDGFECVESALNIYPASTFLHLCELAIYLRRTDTHRYCSDARQSIWQARLAATVRKRNEERTRFAHHSNTEGSRRRSASIEDFWAVRASARKCGFRQERFDETPPTLSPRLVLAGRGGVRWRRMESSGRAIVALLDQAREIRFPDSGILSSRCYLPRSHGATHCWDLRPGSWRRPWPRGSTVGVLYNPNNRKRVSINCFTTRWSGPLTIAGLIAFVVAFWLLKRSYFR
jgi:hypothetical protein